MINDSKKLTTDCGLSEAQIQKIAAKYWASEPLDTSSEAGLSEMEQKILLLQRKEFDTLGDGYVRLSAVLAIVRQVATREQTALAKEARDAAKETGR